MSVSPMKLVTIAGPLPEFDRVTRSCLINREFHPESALQVMRQVKGLLAFEQHNPYTDLLRQAQLLSDHTGIELDYREFPADDYTADDASAFFTRLEARHAGLYDEQKELQVRIEENDHLLIQLEHVRDVDVPLQDFFHFEYVKFRFGRMPRELYASFYPHIIDRTDVFFFKTNLDRSFVYGIYMTPRPYAEKVDSLFASLQFERLRLGDRIQGTGDEAIASVRQDTLATRLRLAELAEEIERLRREETAEFLRLYSFVRYMNDSYDIRRWAAHTEESFYILGWVPEDAFDDFSANLTQYGSLNFVVSEDPEGVSDFTPPVKLKNWKIFKPFEPFISMYGLPSYNEMDPTPLMAITYSLLYGAMFGDLGHGLTLALIGFLMWKLKGMWLGRVLVYTGFSSALFGGIVYGSIFGYEDLGWGFKVLHPASNSQLILTITIYAGAGLITLAILLNIINGLRQRSVDKAVLGSSGLVGVALYWGLMLLALPFIGFGSSVVKPGLLLLGILAPVIVLFLREPLSHLVEHRKKWKPPNGTGDFLASSFFELFETLLGYLTNTLSFLRVGAYAISHASMMTVVYTLAEGAGGGRLPVLILGNLIVIGMEAFLVGIQVLRLDFYELFSRFYSGEGRLYEPIKIDYRGRSSGG